MAPAGVGTGREAVLTVVRPDGAVETTTDNAKRFGETLRSLVAEKVFSYEGREVSVTVSVGVGQFRSDMRRPAELVAVADAALYRAKAKGRNQVSA